MSSWGSYDLVRSEPRTCPGHDAAVRRVFVQLPADESAWERVFTMTKPFKPPVGFPQQLQKTMTAEDALRLLTEIEAQGLVTAQDALDARRDLESGQLPSDVLQWLAERATR